MEKKEIIERAYNDIVARGIWNNTQGENLIDKTDLLRDIPEKMYRHINKGGEGDSFIFTLYLMKSFHDQGISSAMVTVCPCAESIAAVMYQDGDQFLYCKSININTKIY